MSTDRVREIAGVLRITELLNKRPSALSGGDMQRVAIGRALVRKPKAMLMDEPIGALDAKLREEMRAEIKRLHIKQGSTTIYVTHDQIEAMSLADRIVIMHEGKLQQVGSPQDVYAHPANMFVAQFVGSPVMNIAPAEISLDKNAVKVAVGGGNDAFQFPAALTGQLDAAKGAAGSLAMGIRPEGVLVARDKKDGYLPVEAHIIEPLGSYDIVDLMVGKQLLRARTRSRLRFRSWRKGLGADRSQPGAFLRHDQRAEFGGAAVSIVRPLHRLRRSPSPASQGRIRATGGRNSWILPCEAGRGTAEGGGGGVAPHCMADA